MILNDVKNASKILKDALRRPGFEVIISRRVCALYGDRLKRRKGQPIIPSAVDKAACDRNYTCIREFFCPAISMANDGRATIARGLCDGCMVCSKLCLSMLSRARKLINKR